MRCERCGEPVSEYALGEATAIACDACGFLDVPVDHEREPRPEESWQDAFDRFFAKFGADGEAEQGREERRRDRRGRRGHRRRE